MRFDRIVISSGHGKHVAGASGLIDEVTESRRLVDAVADDLGRRGVDVVTYHDDVSTTQQSNLERIVDFHNSKDRDLDVSIHFNAYVECEKPMGTECLYYSDPTLASQVSAAISWCGLLNRGPKKRTDLYFLSQTSAPAILVETCFVDSSADVSIYEQRFEAIVDSIAGVLAGADTDHPQPPEALLAIEGKASWFGGPDDSGVDHDEPLAFIHTIEQAPHLFLPYQQNGSGLARLLNPFTHYLACRWDYSQTPHEMLLNNVALVTGVRTGISLTAFPADWGPHESTGRVADLSPSLLADLGLTTDDEVQIVFPYKEDAS